MCIRDSTSTEHPDGVYHPHADVQHIKKENIGLIEVMGLAILPSRLKDELMEIEAYLLGQENNIAPYHKEWAEQIKQEHTVIREDTVHDLVFQAVGQTFARVLEDAGVYKQTPEGQKAFKRFVMSLGVIQ